MNEKEKEFKESLNEKRKSGAEQMAESEKKVRPFILLAKGISVFYALWLGFNIYFYVHQGHYETASWVVIALILWGIYWLSNLKDIKKWRENGIKTIDVLNGSMDLMDKMIMSLFSARDEIVKLEKVNADLKKEKDKLSGDLGNLRGTSKREIEALNELLRLEVLKNSKKKK